VARQVTEAPLIADRAEVPVERRLAPLITREIAAIAAIDAAITAEKYPDYAVMYHATKTGKQANVEQMATLIRRRGRIPPEHGGFRRYVLTAQSAIAERIVGTTATLQAMRVDELSLLRRYTETIAQVEGLTRDALRKALGRTLVHCHLLTAHIAKRTGIGSETESLPQPLDRYFAGSTAKACMRCHLDRAGALPALERGDPHPYTYICAGCHVDVRAEFPQDIISQIDRWPASVRQARVVQHAIGRPSMLNAIYTVLYPLSGLTAERPARAEEKAMCVPPLEPPPAPAVDEARAVLAVEPRTDGEAAYVAKLFDYKTVREFW
jgi:hypothetical protein